MKCEVFKSEHKASTYLYIKMGSTYDDLPENLQSLLGEISPVLRLDLNKTNKLAQVDIGDVIEALQTQGYFLQLPPADILAKQTPSKGFVE